jgi:hypothetical protein
MNRFFSEYASEAIQDIINQADTLAGTFTPEQAEAKQIAFGQTILALVQDEQYLAQCETVANQCRETITQRLCAAKVAKLSNADICTELLNGTEATLADLAKALPFFTMAKQAVCNTLRAGEDVAFSLAQQSGHIPADQLDNIKQARIKARAEQGIEPAADYDSAVSAYVEALGKLCTAANTQAQSPVILDYRGWQHINEGLSPEALAFYDNALNCTDTLENLKVELF